MLDYYIIYLQTKAQMVGRQLFCTSLSLWSPQLKCHKSVKFVTTISVIAFDNASKAFSHPKEVSRFLFYHLAQPQFSNTNLFTQCRIKQIIFVIIPFFVLVNSYSPNKLSIILSHAQPIVPVLIQQPAQESILQFLGIFR